MEDNNLYGEIESLISQLKDLDLAEKNIMYYLQKHANLNPYVPPLQSRIQRTRIKAILVILEMLTAYAQRHKV